MSNTTPRYTPDRPARQVTGSPYFLVVVAIYVTALITANTVAVKVLNIGPFTTDAGLLTFPITYIVGDILTEVYGYATARRVIWLGFICNALAVGVFQLAMVMPAESTWEGQGAYETIFGSTPRLLLASMAAYLVGSFLNAYVMARMKVLTDGKWLWTRTIGSTVFGQGLDTVIFVLIAFGGVFTGGVLWSMVYTNWIVKIGFEVLATPITYKVINTFKKKEQVDVFDRSTNFNPLTVGS